MFFSSKVQKTLRLLDPQDAGPHRAEKQTEPPTPPRSPRTDHNFLRDVCVLWVHDRPAAPSTGSRVALMRKAEAVGAIFLEVSFICT